MIRAAQLLLAWSRGTGAGVELEVTLPAPAGAIPATLHLPGGKKPADAWVVLHGLTVLGRAHPSLLRFARALCSTGSVVLIPEVRSWTRLRIDTGAVIQSVAAGAEFLSRHPRVAAGRIGVVGFSFGATQAMVAAADPRAAAITRVVGFGGYCELGRFAEFMMTGEHEWRGACERIEPDPYARWIVGGNYLELVPGIGPMDRVAKKLLGLAEEAGRGGLHKPEGYMDPFKAEARAGLSAREREVWDLFAPPTGCAPTDLAAAREIGQALAAAGRAAEPMLEPADSLDHLHARPVLAHGRGDRLIPYTETLRLRERLPSSLRPSATVTRLFEHSVGAGNLPASQYAVEVVRLLRFFHAALRRRR
jgi:pimeloyl-ACP methyl ester carboxylesterase